MTRGVKTLISLRALALAALFFSLASSYASAGPLNSYNLIVFGNLDSNSEVEGTTFVGGNLSGTANYGIKLSVPKSTVTLQVGGSITSGNIQQQAGSLEVGSNINGGVNVNMNSQGNYAVGGTVSGNVNNGTHIPLITPPDVTPLKNALLSQSAALATLTANSTATILGNQITFNATPSGPSNMAVFNVSAANVFENGGLANLVLNANGASAIVINVSGSSVNWNNGMNEIGDIATDALRQKVIWNFYQATSINLQHEFNGALLAPLASLTNSTSIDGSVAVASFTQRGEVHLPVSTIDPVPEPATASLAVTAIAFFAGCRLWRARGGKNSLNRTMGA